MPEVYKDASLVISRSGALTVAEILQTRRPAILIPYPRKGQNDQTSNAYLLENLGVSRVVEQGNEFTSRLWSTLQDTFQSDALERMHLSSSKLRTPNALATIGNLVQSTLGLD